MFVMLTAYDTDDSYHLVICFTIQTPSGLGFTIACTSLAIGAGTWPTISNIILRFVISSSIATLFFL
ncbi:hypothetical protein OPV22_008616 [Ensete ventricosum]|uniref:Uncharacterized protein n=1 Tax=Ensete ventricosum TaxID=4639 RepID=A0AAV8R8S9_ENSVE|nr:hypothetical protein OPV22_008616 [Ensete ventricosum]